MKQYHKIQTLFKREKSKGKSASFAAGKIIIGTYADPVFRYLQSCEWVFDEKVDGTNIRIMYDGQDLKYGGKSDRAMLPPKLLERLHERFDDQLERFRDRFARDADDDRPVEICFYGEGHGKGIQKVGYQYRDDQDFVLFDIKIGHWWLTREAIEGIAGEFDIPVVPIVGRGTICNMIDLVEGGFQSAYGDFVAEGVIARPSVRLQQANGGRIITKLKVVDFE